MLSSLCLCSHTGCPSDLLLPRAPPTPTPFLLSSSTLAVEQQGYYTSLRRPNIHKQLASICYACPCGLGSYLTNDNIYRPARRPRQSEEGRARARARARALRLVEQHGYYTGLWRRHYRQHLAGVLVLSFVAAAFLLQAIIFTYHIIDRAAEKA